MQDTTKVIASALDVLLDAVNTDDDYWGELGVGQDSGEAENSGYLAGYRDALSAVHTLIAYGDVTTLNGYLDSIKETMEEQREEIGERA